MWISGARIIFILISSPVGLRRSLRAAIDCSSLMPNARLFCVLSSSRRQNRRYDFDTFSVLRADRLSYF